MRTRRDSPFIHAFESITEDEERTNLKVNYQRIEIEPWFEF